MYTQYYSCISYCCDGYDAEEKKPQVPNRRAAPIPITAIGNAAGSVVGEVGTLVIR